jgi:hypothetical protein
MDSQISLAERYREVAKRDQKFEIFGAEKYKYRPKKVSVDEIKEFELVIGCDLPEDYRQFLLDVGAGVGPYYGLWSFDEIREELNSIYDDYQDEYNVRARPCDPFELEETMFSTRISLKDDSKFMDAPRNPGGFLPICHQGCEYLTVLVTSGALRGWVFETSAFASIHSQWMTAKRPPGIVPRPETARPLPNDPSFSRWFRAWTENALNDLNA